MLQVEHVCIQRQGVHMLRMAAVVVWKYIGKSMYTA